MRVLVIGAAGKTGRLVVSEALRAGHDVIAFVHDEAQFDDGVRVVNGDATSIDAIEPALQGQDAVIDAVGGKVPYKDTELETSAARAIIDGMHRKQIRRLIVISALSVGDGTEHATFLYEHLLKPTLLRGTAKDKAGMEAEVRAGGDLDFVVVRPALLSDADDLPPLRVITGDEKAHSTARKDLARFLVQQLASDEFVGKSVVVANR